MWNASLLLCLYQSSLRLKILLSGLDCAEGWEFTV